MIKFSKNQKLNNVLINIYDSLQELGVEEVKRYYNEFGNEIDYNIAQYGNLLVYYASVRELYKEYKTLAKMSDDKLWNIYKRQVGYVARLMLKENY